MFPEPFVKLRQARAGAEPSTPQNRFDLRDFGFFTGRTATHQKAFSWTNKGVMHRGKRDRRLIKKTRQKCSTRFLSSSYHAQIDTSTLINVGRLPCEVVRRFLNSPHDMLRMRPFPPRRLIVAERETGVRI